MEENLKKYSVRIYLHSYVDFEVEATSPKEAIETTYVMDYDMDQLLDNLRPDTDIEDVVEIID